MNTEYTRGPILDSKSEQKVARYRIRVMRKKMAQNPGVVEKMAVQKTVEQALLEVLKSIRPGITHAIRVDVENQHQLHITDEVEFEAIAVLSSPDIYKPYDYSAVEASQLAKTATEELKRRFFFWKKYILPRRVQKLISDFAPWHYQPTERERLQTKKRGNA